MTQPEQPNKPVVIQSGDALPPEIAQLMAQMGQQLAGMPAVMVNGNQDAPANMQEMLETLQKWAQQNASTMSAFQGEGGSMSSLQIQIQPGTTQKVLIWNGISTPDGTTTESKNFALTPDGTLMETGNGQAPPDTVARTFAEMPFAAASKPDPAAQFNSPRFESSISPGIILAIGFVLLIVAGLAFWLLNGGLK